MALPLIPAVQLTLPGDNSRFDDASLDADRGLLFIAHLGSSQVIEVDVHANIVVRVIDRVDQVHGVLVVPQRHRVYATATGADQLVIIDEDTGSQLGQAPTGDYADGLAYDPVHNAIWTTNERGGSESIVDADSAQVLGSVDLDGEAGNVAYDAATGQMLVDVQSRNVLAVIDPATRAVIRRVPLPGCDHDHGLTLETANRLAFVACDANATLMTIDLNTWEAFDNQTVGDDPDVLAHDAGAGRLYVAAESGWLTVLGEHDRRMTVMGRSHLVDEAHVVAVDATVSRWTRSGLSRPVPYRSRQAECERAARSRRAELRIAHSSPHPFVRRDGGEVSECERCHGTDQDTDRRRDDEERDRIPGGEHACPRRPSVSKGC